MSEELVPATPEEIATALAVGRPLTERMAQTNAEVFRESPGIRELYRDVFTQLMAEAESVPGFGTAMAMVLERYAFVWATQKAADSMDAPLNARDYEKLIGQFRKLFDTVLKSRDDRQADAHFKATFINAFMSTFSAVCDEELEPTASTQLQQKVVARMRAIDIANKQRPA